MSAAETAAARAARSRPAGRASPRLGETVRALRAAVRRHGYGCAPAVAVGVPRAVVALRSGRVLLDPALREVGDTNAAGLVPMRSPLGDTVWVRAGGALRVDFTDAELLLRASETFRGAEAECLRAAAAMMRRGDGGGGGGASSPPPEDGVDWPAVARRAAQVLFQ